MNRHLIAALSAAALAITSGCGGGGGGISITSVNPTSPSYASLQFAVGTANLYGNVRPGLNVVSTLRQTLYQGASAIGASTPAISGPMRIYAHAKPSDSQVASSSGFADPYTTGLNTPVINGGPSLRESGGDSITGTAQTIAPGTPSCDSSGPVPSGFVHCPGGLKPNTTTFGQSGGVFGMGLQPANIIAASAQSYSLQPYPQPFYNASDSVSRFSFTPWGGPPAFDPNKDGMGHRDGQFQAGHDNFGDPYYLGAQEGISVFDGVRVRSGTYTLRVAVSTIGNGGGVSTSYLTKQAHLDASRVLPTIHAPVFVFDGKGGGTFTTTLPRGVTDAYVQIVDFGPGGGHGNNGTPQNCQGPRGTSFAPVYYTVHVVRGTTTYRLPDTSGPNLKTSGGAGNMEASPSLCTAAQNAKAVAKGTQADDIVVQEIGFDYPIYSVALGGESGAPPTKPKLTNAAGTADITISQAQEQDNGSSSQTPLLVLRR